jgi:NAD(P)-dependent dehydrogenase (short-subunit alcohol dehydrogenase family)
MTIQDFTNIPLEQLGSLKDRVAVVTGGARGIGLAIAKRLAEAGADIVIADIDTGDTLKKAVAELKNINSKAVGYYYDTRDADAMEQAAQGAVERFGRLDIWVNDAGIYPEGALLEMENETLDEVIDTNLKGVIYGSRAAARQMQKKGGVILNLSSVAGFKGTSDMAHYNATKYAVRGLTASLAQEWGKKNIRVLAAAPTLIDTPGIYEQAKNIEKDKKKLLETISLGRIGLPDDIARVAAFLVSDGAAFMTGTTVVVDGGDMVLG